MPIDLSWSSAFNWLALLIVARTEAHKVTVLRDIAVAAIGAIKEIFLNWRRDS